MINLTRGEIIEEGLSQAGRPDLIIEARRWLSLFLDKIYNNQDYHWMKKTADGLSTVQDSALPLDYRAGISATFGKEGEITPLTVIWDSAEFDARRNLIGDQSSNVPTFIFIDQPNQTFKFMPRAADGTVWNLQYYFFPELPDHRDANSDDLIPFWRANFSILVDEIKSKAFEFNDDQRQASADQKVTSSIAENKMNNHDRRAGRSRIKLGKQFRNRFD